MIRVIIVDDHFVVREGLKGILNQYPDIEVVGEATDGVMGVQQVGVLSPHVVLLDLRMVGGDGITAIGQIKARHAGTKILVLTTFEDDSEIEAALAAGADGFLLKDTPRKALVDAIYAVAKGEAALAPRVASKLISRARRQDSKPPVELLSERECEVLALVARGQSNRTIAQGLRISEATVKTHLVHIFAKLNVQDRTSAVLSAIQQGYIDMPDQFEG